MQNNPDSPLATTPSSDIAKRLLKAFFWLSFAFIALGILINLGVAGYFASRTNQFLKKATRTDAHVVRMEPNGQDSNLSYPVIEFTDSAQNKHEFRSNVSSNPPAYKVGQTVYVYYDPANPSDAQLDSFLSLWLVPFVFGSISAALLIFLIVISILALIIRWAIKPRA